MQYFVVDNHTNTLKYLHGILNVKVLSDRNNIMHCRCVFKEMRYMQSKCFLHTSKCSNAQHTHTHTKL